MKETILVTGGAGFIGSNFILEWIKLNQTKVVNIDNLTYAGNEVNLKEIWGDKNYQFVKSDINDTGLLDVLFAMHEPKAVIHFAAESHVDRSITGPKAFIDTNINGTFSLLEAARTYWDKLPSSQKSLFRFVHVSTDEVFGSLGANDPAFSETTPYAPNSPYSASKASSDHLVRAYFHTYGLPTITTHCSNNYGPFQYPEKLIPLIISNALSGKDLPVYGDGSNVRDWLYVLDHCSALRALLEKGKPGETYNIGGNQEVSNIEVVKTICSILDVYKEKDTSYSEQIKFVKDRPGHDFRYAINASKIMSETGWKPTLTFEKGIGKTISWYLLFPEWIEEVKKKV